MCFARATRGHVCLTELVVDTVLAHRQLKRSSTEAGGVLLGRLYPRSGDVVVEAVTTPTKADRRSRFSFFRAKRPAQNAVQEAWCRTAGEQNYLGEWHTHPEDDPTPSPIDLSDWARLCNTAVFEQEALFFVIVGRKYTRAWELERQSGELTLLPMVAPDAGLPTF